MLCPAGSRNVRYRCAREISKLGIWSLFAVHHNLPIHSSTTLISLSTRAPGLRCGMAIVALPPQRDEPDLPLIVDGSSGHLFLDKRAALK